MSKTEKLLENKWFEIDKCIRTNLNHCHIVIGAAVVVVSSFPSKQQQQQQQQYQWEWFVKDTHINHICTGCCQKILLDDRYKCGNKRIRKISLHMRFGFGFGLVHFSSARVVSHLMSMSVATTIPTTTMRRLHRLFPQWNNQIHSWLILNLPSVATHASYAYWTLYRHTFFLENFNKKKTNWKFVFKMKYDDACVAALE